MPSSAAPKTIGKGRAVMGFRWEEDDIAELWGEYARKAERFWATQAHAFRPPTDDVILLELVNPHPPYVITNLFIAQYLRMRTGAQIVAIIGHDGAPMGEVARAFGAKVVEPRVWDHARGEQASAPWRQASRLVGADLQRWVLSLNIDGLPVGDVIYDDFLRFQCQTTLTEPGPDLDWTLTKACILYLYGTDVLSRFRVRALVTGHRVYSDYGILARLAAKQGASVFSIKPPSDRFTVRRYDSLPDLWTHEYRFLPSEIAQVPAAFRAELADGGREWIERRFRGQTKRSNEPGMYSAFATELPVLDRRELQTGIGLDPEKFTVCLVSHVFTDEAHSGNWSIYADHHVWLERTLQLARQMPDINWIVKPHPDNVHYKVGPVEAAMVKACGADNVRLFPEGVNGASLRQGVDALVTVRSEAALEFATSGMPVVTTGEAWFSDWGFAIEPKSEEEYLQVLKALPRLERLAPDQVSAACRFAAMRYSFGLVQFLFMPVSVSSFWVPIDWPQYMRDAIDALDRGSVEDDPVYRNFNRQLDDGRKHMMDFERLGLAAPRPVAMPAENDDQQEALAALA